MKANSFHKKFLSFLFFLLAYFTSFAQPPTQELIKSISETSSPEKKTDILFKLTVRYFDGLKFDSALYYANQLREFSLTNNFEPGVGKYFLVKTIEFHMRNKSIELQDAADKAIKIFTKHNDHFHLGFSYRMLAKNKSLNRKYDEAIKTFQKALSFFQVGPNESEMMKTWYDMGRVFSMSDKPDSAAICLLAALQYSQKQNDKRFIFLVSNELGTIYEKAGEDEKAGYYQEYALKNQPPNFSKVLLRNAWEQFANHLIEKKDFRKADSAVAQYEKLNVLLKDTFGMLRGKLMGGKIYYQQRNYPAALIEFRKAYKLSGFVETDFADIAGVTLLMGMTELKVGTPDSAILYLKYARNNSKSFNNVEFEAEACLLIAEAYEKKGSMDSAFRYARLHSFFTDSAYTLKKQKQVLDITARYETNKKEHQIKMLQTEGEADAYLLLLKDEQLQLQQLKEAQIFQQIEILSKQNEINKLDASKKTLSLDNEKKDNEKTITKLKLLETEAAFQKLLTSKESQQKNMAYIGIAAILLLGGFGVYRYTRRKKSQNQQEVLNERLRISRELHDEVGSTLSGLAMYSHLTRQQIKETKTEEVEKSLNTMQQSAGEMVGKLNDIVWLINPEKDSLQRLMERLEEYATGMALSKNIELRTNITPRLSELNLPVETRRNIYLFCKEAINNAVKYSDAGFIELTMKEEANKKISISINDNGKGFEALTVKNGNGLLNMRQRAKDIKGEFILESAKGHGTSITLKCKIT